MTGTDGPAAGPVAGSTSPAGRTLHQAEPVEPGALRRVCGMFVTGVAVITSGDEGHVAGTTVNSFTSVSLDPPLVLFCLHEQSRLMPVLRSTGAFGVNMLAGWQEQVAWAFAGRDPGAVGDGIIHSRHTDCGVPILSEALAFLACRIVHEYPGGDHRIVVGEVVEAGVPRRHEPLIFYQGAFGMLAEAAQTLHTISDG